MPADNRWVSDNREQLETLYNIIRANHNLFQHLTFAQFVEWVWDNSTHHVGQEV